ncbi:unnamed protein product [Heterobilharzia americana]|nr:unnamed protein product [Heterobilharzia americana]
MLPKKKRWMAAAHTSPTNLASPPSMTTESNVGPKKLCCDTPMQTIGSTPRSLSNSISSPQPPVKTLPTGGGLLSASDPYGMSTLQQQQQHQQAFVNRSGSNISSEYIHCDKSQTTTSRQSSHSIRSTPPGRRNDMNSNLITTISQYPTELLQQQPGLLLQVLPQEYLANYAQNLAKLNANKNPVETMHLSPNDYSLGSKINKTDTMPLQNSAYSQGLVQQTDTQGRQTYIPTHNNMSSASLRIKCSENSKIQRTPQTLRSSPVHNSPVFQCPAPTNSQRFSPPPHPPPRHLSGSGEQIRNTKPMTQNHQLPAGFDLPTISAVARAASMLSPSQLEAAAALLSQWDNASHLALLANNPSYRNLCNIPELSGNKQPSNSGLSFSPLISSESNPVSSSYMDNHMQNTCRTGTIPSVSTGTMSDLRYSSMKPNPSLPRSMESTNRLNSRSSTPVNEPQKSDHMCCPPWLTVDQRTYPIDSSHSNKPQPSPRDHIFELADSRLAILHDAKLASLSVDWPSCTISQNIPMSKASRTRSSSSFSSTACQAVSVPNTPESSFSVNQLHTKTAERKFSTSSSSSSSASFVTSESVNKTQISGQCSPNLSVSFSFKEPSVHPQTSSCCQTITPPSPNIGMPKIPNSTQSQFLTHSTENSPNAYSQSSPFVSMTTNSTVSCIPTEVTNKTECDRPNIWSNKLSIQSEQINRQTPVDSSIITPNSQIQPKQDPIKIKITSDTNLPDQRSQNTSMPLKKRLIQRYEADRIDIKPPDLTACNSPKNELIIDNARLQNRSTYSENIQNDQYLSENRFTMKENVEKNDCQEKKFKQRKRSKYNSGGGILGLKNNESKPIKIITKSSSNNLRKPGAKCLRRSKLTLCETELNSVKSEFDLSNEDSLKTIILRRSRKHNSSVNSTSSLSHTSLCHDSIRGTGRRRIAAVNGNLMMMVTARAQRSTSSGSSSSSLRSVEGECSDNEVCPYSSSSSSTIRSKSSLDRQLSYSKISSYKSTLKCITGNANNHSISVDESQTTHSSIDNTNNGSKKSKRTGALTVSTTTLSSTVKKPRLSTKHQHTDDDDDDKLRNNHKDNSSTLLDHNDSISVVSENSYENPIPDELSAALAEENLQFEELVKQLPGPPDLNRTANKSLHSTHSLNFYKRSQRVFVQLINCNDPGLKQVPKCRACRQTKVSYHHNSPLNNLLNGIDSDDDNNENKILTTNEISSPNNQNYSDGLDKNVQFKRPPGRRSTTEKNKQKDNNITTDKSKSKRNTIIHSPVSVFCRFWGFRKLCFNSRGVLKVADFCQSTESDASERSLWEMYHPVSPFLSTYAARYILECAGGLFCHLLHQELTTLNGSHSNQLEHEKVKSTVGKNGTCHSELLDVSKDGNNIQVAWKKPVKGVREMCDVCETTMFNTHWVCGKCGYSVCTDCLNESGISNPLTSGDTKENGKLNENSTSEKAKTKYSRGRGGPFGWASCTTTRQYHDPNKLLLTSLLPSGIIGKLIHRLHRIANYYQINLGCHCSSTRIYNDNFSMLKTIKSLDNRQHIDQNSLNLLADIALKTDELNTNDTHVTHFIDPMIDSSIPIVTNNDIKLFDSKQIKKFPSHNWIHSRSYSIKKVCQNVNNLTNTTTNNNNNSSIHDEVNTKNFQTKEMNHQYPVVLRLHCPDSPGVILAFQSQWRVNHPIIISGCQHKFTRELWTPQSFCDDFGELKTVLVDCATGAEITRYSLKTFWEGFERRERRITSKDGRALCLKLKDWPTTDDFAELQPKRYSDLMSNLPMPDYTRRDGQLNLAARLASFFVCPDLGPKLYVAYGTVGSSSVSTTNLHVDIADAVNVMLYVGQSTDSVNDMLLNAETVMNTLKSAHVDISYLDKTVNWLNRIKSYQNTVCNNHNIHESEYDDIPGALWHIFLPEDLTVLREFLSRVSEDETGTSAESGSDPIHDQLFYLDQPLLDRLYDYMGIQPCTIVQFLGDAVFIPAGAAHQVRNLNGCIKAAVDFVSPEHLPQCFRLMEEFRQLSPTHQNHEDKLQIKNMLFHGIKDALSVLLTSGSCSDADVSDRGRSNQSQVSCCKSEPNSDQKLSQRIDGFDIRARSSSSTGVGDSRMVSDISDVKMDMESETIHHNLQGYDTNTLKPNNSRGGRCRGRPGRPKAVDLVGNQSIRPHSSSSGSSPSISPNPVSNSPSIPSVHSVVTGSSSYGGGGPVNSSALSSSFKISSKDSVCTPFSTEKIKDVKPNIIITDCDRIPTTTTTSSSVSMSSSLCTSASSPPVNSDASHILSTCSFPSSSSSTTSSSLSSSSSSSLLQHQYQQQPLQQHQNGTSRFLNLSNIEHLS